MKIIKRAIQPLLCLMILVGTVAHANTYVLNGNPTGLVSSAGAGSYSGGHYTASDSGTGGFAHGPATFKYVWQKSTTVPEDAPLTVIFHVHTLATVWGADSGSSANNGYANATYGPVMVASADEYIVQSGGTNVEFTINPTAAVGSTSGGYCAVDISFDVIPVRASIDSVTWYGSPLSAHILNGEQTGGSLNVGELNCENYSWIVPSTRFVSWDPNPSFSTLTHVTNLQVQFPSWIWNSELTQVVTVTGSADLLLPSNIYNPTTVPVTDEAKVQVVRPTCTVNGLAFVKLTQYADEGIDYPPFPWTGPRYFIRSWITATGGSVTWPIEFSSGAGTYCFVQKIISSERVQTPQLPNSYDLLDKAVPYPYLNGPYGRGQPAVFSDTPETGSETLPVSTFALFETTIMFRPASAGANWVPLKKATWQWFKAYGSPPTTACTKWLTTTAHPSWTGFFP